MVEEDPKELILENIHSTLIPFLDALAYAIDNNVNLVSVIIEKQTWAEKKIVRGEVNLNDVVSDGPYRIHTTYVITGKSGE